jgi:ATP-dependent DNA helicase RecG
MNTFCPTARPRCWPASWKTATTTAGVAAEVFEIDVPEGTGKLLVVRVHEGDSKPYGTAAGPFKQRVGKNCMPLDPVTFQRAQVRSAAVDWSGSPANGLALQDLDPLQIERARQVLRSKAACVGSAGIA